MRELKFRAWDKTHKKMLDRVLAGPGDPCSIVWDDERKEWLNFDEFCGDIMQYTGLKDKNGQEIYEGDIVRASPYGRPDSARGTCVYAVVFSEFEGMWILKDERKVEECPPLYAGGIKSRIDIYLEVIGNVYEHPERPEGKQ